MAIELPNGAPLITTQGVTFRPGERSLITGPSGAGKPTLFRSIAGIWPFGSGVVLVPEAAKVILLPQRTYIPRGSLKEAVTYPLPGEARPSAEVAEALQAVGLSEFARRLDDQAQWDAILSPGEQQKVGIARAILHAPDFLFLDEATASLDNAAEAALYRLLQDRLPHTTIVSIAHRATLNEFHNRQFLVHHAGGRRILGETTVAEPARS